MWSFKSAWDSDGHPLLHSLNGNIGRQTWVFDPDAGTDEDRAAIEKLREDFRRNRHEQKHSSDELLRYGTLVGHVRVVVAYFYIFFLGILYFSDTHIPLVFCPCCPEQEQKEGCHPGKPPRNQSCHVDVQISEQGCQTCRSIQGGYTWSEGYYENSDIFSGDGCSEKWDIVL